MLLTDDVSGPIFNLDDHMQTNQMIAKISVHAPKIVVSLETDFVRVDSKASQTRSMVYEVSE